MSRFPENFGMRHILFIAFFCLISSTVQVTAQSGSAHSQSERKVRYQSNISLATMLGGFVTIDNFEFQPGFEVSTTHAALIQDVIVIGGGVGFQQFEDFSTLPIYVHLGFQPTKKDGRHALLMNLGYARQWSEIFDQFDDVDMPGGLIFQQLYRLNANLFSDLKLSFTIGYSYQKAFFRLEPIPGVNDSPVSLNFHHLLFGIGLGK